jgi:hypothetical protein
VPSRVASVTWTASAAASTWAPSFWPWTTNRDWKNDAREALPLPARSSPPADAPNVWGKVAASRSPSWVPAPPLSALISARPRLLFQNPISAVWPSVTCPVAAGSSP